MQPATLDEPRRTHSQLLNTIREEHHNNMHILHIKPVLPPQTLKTSELFSTIYKNPSLAAQH